ncbi:MAG: hypothetical protein WCQ54_14110 [Clostridiaceae bacterium]
MKRIIEDTKLVFVFISILTIIFTMLSTYHILPLRYFDSYFNIELCILITAALGAIQTLQSKNRDKYKTVLLLYMLMVFGSLFFILMKVN